jgi:hypothetical protein
MQPERYSVSTPEVKRDEPFREARAAQHLNLKVATLRAWRHQNRGPAFVRLGRAIRYLRSDLDDFLHAHRHAPGSDKRPLA